jgi:peptidoglycan/LPS O-acetylase OafA/YrhL
VPGTDHRGWLALLFAFDYSPYFALGIVFYSVSKKGWSPPKGALVLLALATEYLIRGWPGIVVASVVVVLFVLAIRGSLRFMVSPVTLWLGSISYSLYLIHRNLGYNCLTWLHGKGLGPLVAVPIVIAGALAIATAVTFTVEKPAMRRIRVWYEARTGRDEHVSA